MLCLLFVLILFFVVSKCFHEVSYLSTSFRGSCSCRFFFMSHRPLTNMSEEKTPECKN